MTAADSPWIRAMPAVFVLIWSTGFIVARYGMPHAPPMTFLAWRHALSIACFGVWIALARVPWPRGAAASVSSLMYLVPPCTAALAWLLFGEPVTLTTLIGTALTAAGVALVVRASRGS